mmetsp:Transcript_9836/g.24288  ORF Transcript_9836/g.24288 Transcript_9836/m.24288 type:complete len:226 (+) Transcript_9836:1574-2251(+)
MHQRCYLSEERLADFAAQQAAAGGEYDELGQRIEKVNLALVTPFSEEVLCLLNHHPHVLAQAVGFKRVRKEPELFGARVVVHVEHHALSEGGHVELVHFLLAHLRVLGFEEMLAYLGADEERDALVEHRYGENLAVLGHRVSHEPHGPLEELRHPAHQGPGANHRRRPARLEHRGEGQPVKHKQYRRSGSHGEWHQRPTRQAHGCHCLPYASHHLGRRGCLTERG